MPIQTVTPAKAKTNHDKNNGNNKYHMSLPAFGLFRVYGCIYKNDVTMPCSKKILKPIAMSTMPPIPSAVRLKYDEARTDIKADAGTGRRSNPHDHRRHPLQG